jgi:hypothetical protein
VVGTQLLISFIRSLNKCAFKKKKQETDIERNKQRESVNIRKEEEEVPRFSDNYQNAHESNHSI